MTILTRKEVDFIVHTLAMKKITDKEEIKKTQKEKRENTEKRNYEWALGDIIINKLKEDIKLGTFIIGKLKD